ncbi:hypothetical protein ABZ371_11500, partial [Streptomyces sp. NPDC005899]
MSTQLGDAGVIGFRREDLVMARRLRFNGTGSGEGSCPAVHDHLDTGGVIGDRPRRTPPPPRPLRGAHGQEVELATM